jgi:hypothetical protein
VTDGIDTLKVKIHKYIYKNVVYLFIKLFELCLVK